MSLSSNRFRGFLYYILAALLIYTSGSALTSTDAGYTIGGIMNAMIYTFILVRFIKIFMHGKVSNRLFIMLALVLLFTLIEGVNYPSGIDGVFKRMILLWLMFVLAFELDKLNIQFDRIIFDVIFWIACISLIFFVLINLFHLQLPAMEIRQDTLVYKNYYFLFYTAERYKTGLLIGLPFYRLQGIFWEPGAFAVYLDLALFYALFIGYDDVKTKKKQQILKIIVLLVATTLTLSTTGLCIAVALVGIKFIELFRGKSKILMIIPAALIAGSIISAVWMQKKGISTNAWSSYNLRMNDMTNSLELWKENFLFGTGFKNTDSFEATIEGRGNSNGLLTWCYTMGLFGAVALVFPFVRNAFNKGKNVITQLLYCAVFLLVNMTEPIISSYFIVFLVAKEYNEYLKSTKKRHFNVKGVSNVRR